MIKFKLPLMAFSIILFIVACSKKNDIETLEVTKTTRNNERTINRVEEISARYLRSVELTTQDRLPGGRAYSYCDLVAQYGLYAAGLSFSQATANAARNSIICAKNEGYSEIPELPETPISEINPYEIYGVMHVDLLHEQLTTDPGATFEDGVPNNENYIIYAKDYLRENYGSTEEELAGLTLELLEESLTILEEPSDYSMVTFVGNCRISGELSDLEADILEPYYEVMENVPYAIFSEYSLLVEDEILASDFTEAEKGLLLMSMAVARHDIGYWDHNK